MTKAEARKFYLEKRRALSDAEWVDMNRTLIGNSVSNSEFVKRAETIHIFLPIRRNREPDLETLLALSNKKIVLPRMNPDGTMDHFYYQHPAQLVENSFGIREPYAGVAADVKDIDLVFVPLLAFDVAGNRVGYGKGYYDRFLKECRPDCVKAGVSFYTAEKKFSDVEEHDVRLDVCLTPYKTYTFGSS